MMTGFMLRYDSLEEHSFLTDEQYGRLIRAALAYARDGQEPELGDPERYLWPGLRQKVIQDREQYEKKCAQNRENISQRWGQQPEQDTTVYDRIRPNTNDTNININHQDQEINININHQDQINIRQQLKADGYTDSEIDSALAQAQGKQIRSLKAYLKKTIDNGRKQQQPPQQKQKRVSAQEYPQRDYAGVQAQIEQENDAEMQEWLKQQKGEDSERKGKRDGRRK